MQKWPRVPLDGGEGYYGGTKGLRTVAHSSVSFKTPSLLVDVHARVSLKDNSCYKNGD
jgi:hypothetical protein